MLSTAFSDYLATERTLLSWIRTGLALMGFGYVVARFGLFLQQLQILERPHATASYGFSLWLGTGLIGFGVIVNAFAGWRHLPLVRDLDRGAKHSGPSKQVVAVAFVLALAGWQWQYFLFRFGARPTPSEDIRIPEFGCAILCG